MMPDEITFENLIESLEKTIPELKPKLDGERRWWGKEKPGAHIIFGDIFSPFLTELLKKKKNEEILKRIFGYLEELGQHKDERVQEVLVLSLLDNLWEDKKALDIAQGFMGERTKNLLKDIGPWKKTSPQGD